MFSTVKRKLSMLKMQNRPRWLRLICYIGHDLHGHFDRNHIDFEICCGLFHTEKVAFLLPILIAIVGVDMTVAINVYRLSAINNLHAAPLIPNVIFLWRGIRTNNHRMVWCIFVLNTVLMGAWLSSIGMMIYTVFYPLNMASDYVGLLCNSEFVGWQLAILSMILIFSVNFYLMVYLNWNVLFVASYMYHMNTNMCAHTSDCPGLGDYDPNWHRIKP